MNLDRVTSGRDLPDDFNVIIEIPMNADPVKYEVDKGRRGSQTRDSRRRRALPQGAQEA